MRANDIVVIHQPDFIPYTGFFHRLLKANIYVVMDDVQYVRGSKDHWTNRDRIKTANGSQWISISVKKNDRFAKIRDMRLTDDSEWRKKGLNRISENYREAIYYNEIFPYVEKIFEYHETNLSDFNLFGISVINQLLDIKTTIIKMSDLKVSGKKNELLINIIKAIGVRRYLSGEGARNYLDEKKFEDSDIEVIWQNFNHPLYTQLHGGFIPYLSVIDLLLNCGIEKSRKIIRSCDGE